MTNILIEIKLAFLSIVKWWIIINWLVHNARWFFLNHYILYFERNRTRLSKHNRLEVFFRKTISYYLITFLLSLKRYKHLSTIKRISNELLTNLMVPIVSLHFNKYKNRIKRIIKKLYYVLLLFSVLLNW